MKNVTWPWKIDSEIQTLLNKVNANGISPLLVFDSVVWKELLVSLAASIAFVKKALVKRAVSLTNILLRPFILPYNQPTWPEILLMFSIIRVRWKVMRVAFRSKNSSSIWKNRQKLKNHYFHKNSPILRGEYRLLIILHFEPRWGRGSKHGFPCDMT